MRHRKTQIRNLSSTRWSGSSEGTLRINLGGMKHVECQVALQPLSAQEMAFEIVDIDLAQRKMLREALLRQFVMPAVVASPADEETPAEVAMPLAAADGSGEARILS
jgi:hypothetical protein